MQVTEAGRVLLQYAETIFRDLKNAEMAVRELNTMKRGTVRLGVGPTTLTYRLPHVLGEYSRRFPDIELIVLAGTTEFLLDALRSQHLDLAVVMRTPSRPGITVTPLGSEEMIIVVNRDHPLARQKTIEPADLASLRFILYEKNTAMQNVIDRFFESLGVAPRVTMEVENNEAIKSLVRAGLGASIMPLCAVSQEPPDSTLRVLRVRNKPLNRELRLVAAASEILPNTIQELAAMLVRELGSRRAARSG